MGSSLLLRLSKDIVFVLILCCSNAAVTCGFSRSTFHSPRTVPLSSSHFRWERHSKESSLGESNAMDQISSTSSESLKDAAAQLTTSQFKLLGTKAVGVDYGLVRTGLAVTVGYEPKPLSIVSNLNNTELCNHIVQLAEAENAARVVLGLPFHKNGTEAEQTVITRDFAKQLVCSMYAHFGPSMPLYFWDERYTSKEAAARARAIDPKAVLYKQLDADAACLILEYYYEDDGVGAIKVELPEDAEVRRVVELAWETRQKEKKADREEYQKERENSFNARKIAMERARLLDEKLAREGVRSHSKKKKKKKKKKSGGWITL